MTKIVSEYLQKVLNGVKYYRLYVGVENKTLSNEKVIKMCRKTLQRKKILRLRMKECNVKSLKKL